MRFPALLAFLAVQSFAAVNPTALTVNVSVDQKRAVEVNARNAQGATDKTTSHVRILNVECRLVGSDRPEPVTIRWFFVRKSNVTGKFENHANGSDEITIPVGRPVVFEIESEPVDVREYERYRGGQRQAVTAGGNHHGWVLWVVQNGIIVKVVASERGLDDWLRKNLPKQDGPKKR